MNDLKVNLLFNLNVLELEKAIVNLKFRKLKLNNDFTFKLQITFNTFKIERVIRNLN